MVNVIGIVIGTLIIIGLGGGGFYVIWLITRPKKMTWKAKIFQLSDGVKPAIKDKDGNILSDTKLNDLRPYGEDVIEKIEKEPGITVYRLVKMNKVVPQVTSEYVDYWGPKKKEVSVLLVGDTPTLLKKGYNKAAGAIFDPMAHDRINMMTGQMAIRKDRLRKEKDILQAITPWIVTGMCMLALFGIAYLTIEGFTKMSETNAEAQKYTADKSIEAANIMANAMNGKIPNMEKITKEEPPIMSG
jgi:hypothetical protein